MCTRRPYDCALRDDHDGPCLTPQQLEATITNLTCNTDTELEELWP